VLPSFARVRSAHLAFVQGLPALACVFALIAPARGEDAPAQSAPAPGASAPETPPCVFERYVSVAAAEGFDPHLADEVRKDLSAELAPRGFGVCPSRAAQGELVAEVALVQREPALVAIQVEDYTTGKRVARDVRLARIPSGGVALAIAIAADELLRASWAELLLRRNEAARAEHPDQPAVAPRPASAETPRSEPWHKHVAKVPAAVALGIDYAHSPKQWDGFGLDLRLQLRPLRYGFFEVGGGGVLARPVAGDSGTVRAAGALALMTLGACGALHTRVVLCGGARGTFQWTRFRGTDAQQDGKARQVDLTSFVLSALAQAQVLVASRVFVFGELSLGGAPVSAHALDRDGTLVAIQGLMIGAALGVGYAP
jgi:hypothetical protein